MNAATTAVLEPRQQDGVDQDSEQREQERPGCSATRHDTAIAYRHSGCRCPQARRAFRRYKTMLELGTNVPAMVDALGSQRRIHALQAAGYPLAMIGAALGYSSGRSGLSPLLSPRRHAIRRELADKITALYQHWSRLPGPSRSAQLRAQHAGHPSPACWRGRDIDDPHARPGGLAGPSGRGIISRIAPGAGDDQWGSVACRSGQHDPDLWFTDQHQAIQLCQGCPMRRPCLRDALLRNETQGVWGGLTGSQRQALRRELLAQLGEGEALAGSAVLEQAITALDTAPDAILDAGSAVDASSAGQR